MKKDADPSNKYHNQSIIKAISALKLFSHTEYELSISTIAERLETPISTTHRILNTLESVGYISKNADNGKYRLGIGCFILGSNVRLYQEMAQKAQPFLQELSQRYNETVNFSVGTDKDEILCIAKINANRSFFATPEVGGTRKIQISSCGKCILAFADPAKQNSIISRIEFRKYTPNSISTEMQLREQLEVIRRTGYAIDNMEGENGLYCCGAPVFFENSGECAGAISISIPIGRVPSPIDNLIADVVHIAKKISRELSAGCI